LALLSFGVGFAFAVLLAGVFCVPFFRIWVLLFGGVGFFPVLWFLVPFLFRGILAAVIVFSFPFLYLGGALVLSGFSIVGFSGSRSLSGAAFLRCRALAGAVSRSGASVLTGCASGADLAARLGAGSSVTVFRAVSRARWDLIARSVRFVSALSAAPGSCLVSFPGVVCPVGVSPSGSWVSCGSGSWSGLSLAAGLGVPCFVFLPRGVRPPYSWGAWSFVRRGPFRGAWFLSVFSGQGSLF